MRWVGCTWWDQWRWLTRRDNEKKTSGQRIFGRSGYKKKSQEREITRDRNENQRDQEMKKTRQREKERVLNWIVVGRLENSEIARKCSREGRVPSLVLSIFVFFPREIEMYTEGGGERIIPLMLLSSYYLISLLLSLVHRRVQRYVQVWMGFDHLRRWEQIWGHIRSPREERGYISLWVWIVRFLRCVLRDMKLWLVCAELESSTPR